jgi:hypothetical protein
MKNSTINITITNSQGQSEKIQADAKQGHTGIRLKSKPGDVVELRLEDPKDLTATVKKGLVRRLKKDLVIEDADGQIILVLLDHFEVGNVRLHVDAKNFTISGDLLSSSNSAASSSFSTDSISALVS